MWPRVPTYAAFVTCSYNLVYCNCKLTQAIFVGACMRGNKDYNYVTITGNKESIHAGSAKVYNIYVTLIISVKQLMIVARYSIHIHCSNVQQEQLFRQLARDQNSNIQYTAKHKTKFRHMWAHTMCQGKTSAEEKTPKM